MFRKKDDYWKARAIELENQLDEAHRKLFALETKGLPDAPDYACGLCNHCFRFECEPGEYKAICLYKSNCPNFSPITGYKPIE